MSAPQPSERIRGSIIRVRDLFAKSRPAPVAEAPQEAHPEMGVMDGEVRQKIAEIERVRAEATAGEMADSWLKGRFSQNFLDHILAQADIAFDKLRKGEIEAKVFNLVYDAVEETAVYPHVVSARGQSAREQLEAWRKDGTLEAADHYLASGGKE